MDKHPHRLIIYVNLWGIFMLNYIWAFMVIAGVLYGGIQGGVVIGSVADGALDSAKEAVELCIVMLGVVGMWNGIMNIAREAGLIARWTKGFDPVISFLFPRIPKNHSVRQDIATNMIANILGLGWAATPAGLEAMRGLANLAREQKLWLAEGDDVRGRKGGGANVATNEMCTFLVMNISSLQLIPMTIIVYRSQYGSVAPTAVIGPGLAATLTTTLVAVIFCKAMCRR